MNKQRNGYSLVETLVTIVVIAMGFNLMQLAFKLNGAVSQHTQRTTQFYRYLDVIEDPQFQFRVRQVTASKLELFSAKEQQVYCLQLAKHELKMRTLAGGYMPLITDVDQVQWQVNSGRLLTKITIGGERFVATTMLAEKC